jgi:CRP/FNR family transcriptional regulator, cyclic AMP receptor protein
VQEGELTSYALFAPLSKQERETVGRYLDKIDVRAGKRLASEGAFAHEFFVIDRGEAVVTRGDETLTTLGPGDFFGEIALVETDRRTASVTAQTDMTVLVMHQSGFATMMAQSPAIAERLQAAIRNRLAADG